MTDNPPAIAVTGEVQIGGLTLTYHILVDGQRIIEKKSFDALIDHLARGGEMEVEDYEKMEKFINGEPDVDVGAEA